MSQAQHAARKLAVFAHYGNACACCGETEPAFLSIDHMNNDGYSRRKADPSHQNLYRWLVKHNFPAEFQTLCMNCQWGKAKHGICPHKRQETQCA